METDLKKYGLVIISLIIIFFLINISTSYQRVDKLKYMSLDTLKSGTIYSLVDEKKQNLDYIKIFENNTDDKKIKVQFLLQPRLATKVAQPWLEYQELSCFLKNEKISLLKNNDTAVSRMFFNKNN